MSKIDPTRYCGHPLCSGHVHDGADPRDSRIAELKENKVRLANLCETSQRLSDRFLERARTAWDLLTEALEVGLNPDNFDSVGLEARIRSELMDEPLP
jgi:hypothetical protein